MWRTAAHAILAQLHFVRKILLCSRLRLRFFNGLLPGLHLVEEETQMPLVMSNFQQQSWASSDNPLQPAFSAAMASKTLWLQSKT